jgi:phosphate transport system protein
MTRETLDRKLNSLLADIQSLEELVEKATTGAVEALKRQDQAAAQKIYDDDKIINTRRFDLENDCVITIATQQPIMAGDLRLVASIRSSWRVRADGRLCQGDRQDLFVDWQRAPD